MVPEDTAEAVRVLRFFLAPGHSINGGKTFLAAHAETESMNGRRIRPRRSYWPTAHSLLRPAGPWEPAGRWAAGSQRRRPARPQISTRTSRFRAAHGI